MIAPGLITPIYSSAQEQSLGNIKISITFTAAPTTVRSEFTYLKYNKAFALVLQADNATSDVYNKVYPLFAGTNGNPIEIGSIKPLFPGRLFLRNRISNTLYNDVQLMALQSTNGHHWIGIYNFRKFGVSPDVSFDIFKGQMEQIATAYGKDGD